MKMLYETQMKKNSMLDKGFHRLLDTLQAVQLLLLRRHIRNLPRQSHRRGLDLAANRVTDGYLLHICEVRTLHDPTQHYHYGHYSQRLQ